MSTPKEQKLERLKRKNWASALVLEPLRTVGLPCSQVLIQDEPKKEPKNKENNTPK